MSCKQPIKEDQNLIENLMNSQPEHFDHIMANKDYYEVQIIYTQINRDENNVPSFKSFSYNVDPNRYFYPASTVKMPVAFMALEKLNELNLPGLDRHATMLTDSAFSGQSRALSDSTSESGLPSIAHYIKKVFLVSDNDAFNRLYEFVGQEEINKKLAEKGFNNSRIIHRLAISLNEEENRHTNPVQFLHQDSVVYNQEMAYNGNPLPLQGTVLKGKGYLKSDTLVEEPFNFSKKNFMPLEDLHNALKAVIFPEAADSIKFNLSRDDYRFLYQYMSQFPEETTWPSYDTSEYFDAYSKFLLYGNEKKPLPKHIRIFNKIGLAYGYMSDHAYVVDFENNVEFLLSAVIHTNENQIYNDGEYEYEAIGYPFMKNLGQLVLDYEKTRNRKHAPNLERFKTSYDKVVQMGDKLHASLYHNYDHYHAPRLNYQQIKHADIEPLINKLSQSAKFKVTQVGKSVEGRSISLISLGSGPKKVLLWSQMHGDESTATRAIFEIFNFFSNNDVLDSYKEQILNNTTLYFIPMLNPDGAEVFERRNALSVDLNRDALRLISPEAEILKRVRDQIEPDFGFNLHDQSRYYNVNRTTRTASISFLAPAYNYEKEVNDVRKKAMQVISSMNNVIQQYAPGHVGKYDDAFEPRAFGDNIQKWGTSTILIESGGFKGDPEKRHLVKLNFVGILHAIAAIADNSISSEKTESYYAIPDNDRNLFDLLIRNGLVEHHGKQYVQDIGIMYNERDPYSSGESRYNVNIEDMGDLSTYAGYKEIDAAGLIISNGEMYPYVLEDISLVTTEKAVAWLRQGYTTVRLINIPEEAEIDSYPIRIVPASTREVPPIKLAGDTYLIIKGGGETKYAVANAQVFSW